MYFKYLKQHKTYKKFNNFYKKIRGTKITKGRNQIHGFKGHLKEMHFYQSMEYQ